MKEYILPFRDLVVNPGLTVPIYIDNPLSVACIEAAANSARRATNFLARRRRFTAEKIF